ncbi:MAG: hypothetical protein ACRD4O_06445 [Bryobacteraceae bacterium]
MAVSDSDRPGHSTGPRSPDGKSRSSRNSTTHGCCATALILPDENEDDFNELKEGWFADYNPETLPAHALVWETVTAHWHLLRVHRRYNEAELALFKNQPNPLLWSEDQHKSIERFTRYRTAAERSFHRVFNALEQLRKSRHREADLLRRAEERAAVIQLRWMKAQQDSQPKSVPRPPQPAPAPKEGFFCGQNAKKNQRKIPILDQWAEITIVNGQTVTLLVPSNKELIEEGKAMDPPPELVYRRLNFVDGIPSEYHWATASLERRERGGMATQRMTVETWLETIAREEAAATGHIGPCGKLVPRPKERGGCDCPVCTQLSAGEPA